MSLFDASSLTALPQRLTMRWIMSIILVAFSACAYARSAPPVQSDAPVSWEKISKLPLPAADKRIQYGDNPLTFGDLRLPKGPGPHPVAVVVHGGCWQSEYDLQYISHLSAALTKVGIATWTIEYRRIGDPGGGWTGTLEDVSKGTDYLRTLAAKFPLDLNRVVLIGHSAGGHIVLWLAARQNIPKESKLHQSAPIAIRGVVGLAAISDLRAYSQGSGSCNRSVVPLMGGAGQDMTDRFAIANPIELLPLRVPVRLIHGTKDPLVPVEQSSHFATEARRRGDDAKSLPIEGAGHFDLVAPFAPAWATVERTVLELVSNDSNKH